MGAQRIPRHLIDLSAVERRKQTLVKALESYRNTVIQGEVFSQLVTRIAVDLDLAYESVASFLAQLDGRVLSSYKSEYISCRLAGLTPALRKGLSVPLVPFSTGKGAHLVQVVDAWHFGKVSVLRVLAVTGPLAGRRWSWKWSWERLRYVARLIGFFKRLRNGCFLSLVSPAQLTQCVFLCGLDWVDRRVRLAKVFSVDSLVRRNVDLLKKRLRIGFSCPLKLGPEKPCHSCPKGYLPTVLSSSCPVACRPYGLIRGTCSSCGKERWVISSDNAEENVCWRCRVEKL